MRRYACGTLSNYKSVDFCTVKEVDNMKNKEMKKPILNELDDDALDHVSGGIEVGDEAFLNVSVWNDNTIQHPDPSEERAV